MRKSTLKTEIITCGREPLYFINKYVRIKHPVLGLIPFKTFPYQDALVKDYLVSRFNVVLKARQLGISEITAAYAAWMMLFHRDKNILVIATKAETAKNMIKKIRTALTKIPKWLMLADIMVDNRMSIELSNGSVAKAIASSEDAGRSEALSLLIVDEGAFIKGMDELWTGLLPTVQAGGRVIVLSTPNGVGNVFHKIYTESVAGTNEFKSTMLMWWEHPDRAVGLEDDPERPGSKTSPWFKNETKNMSEREIAQELCCNFNASGETVIGGESILWLEGETFPPLSMENWDRKLFVWKRYDSSRRYFLSADVCRGDGRDNSAAIVFETEQMEEVAEYYGQLPPDAFAELICGLGAQYGNCMMVVENNSVGLACLEHVKMRGYPNVYYSRRGDQRPGESVNTAYGVFSDDLVVGFTTSMKTRPLILNKLEEYIRTRVILMRSKRFIGEIRTFIWSNGRPEAMRGYNDDLVMAAAMGAWLRDTYISPNFASVDHQRKLIQNIGINRVVNTDIRGASKDPRLVPHQTMGPFYRMPDPYKVRYAGGLVIDLRELLDKK